MAVCLHCRHAERVQVQMRRNRSLARAGVGVLSLAALAVAGRSGIEAVLGYRAAPARTQGRRTVSKAVTGAHTPDARPVAAPPAPAPAFDAPTVQQQGAGSAPVAIAASSASPAIQVDRSARIAPIVAEGRHELTDSLYAVRSGDTVVVNFDASPTRTRRADKFEAVVRRTLPAVYGAIADSLLAAVPDGQLASPATLLTELPASGIHLERPGTSTHALTIFPQTRPGRDGPLVVSYVVISASSR